MAQKSNPQPSSPVVGEKRLKVYVHADVARLEYDLLRRCDIDRADSIDDADIVLFVGGADVNPQLYGEAALRGTNFNPVRDDHDLIGWRAAKDKFKIGICRGGQFLNVMNGGKLWQDVDNHCGSHVLRDRFTNQLVNVSSTHHQQFRPTQSAIVIATAELSTRKLAETVFWERKKVSNANADKYFGTDFEVLFYPETRSLCFQPHPEYIDPSTTAAYFRSVLWKCLRNEYPTKGTGPFAKVKETA